MWLKENVLNRGIIHSTVAVLTSCDQMTSTGNETWCVPKPASRGNSSANLAGLDFSPKSSELTLQWKLLQSEKKSLISAAHFPIFIRLFLFLLEGWWFNLTGKRWGRHTVFIILAKPGSCTQIVTTSADQLSQYLKEVKYLCRRKAAFPPFAKWGLCVRVRRFPVWSQALFWCVSRSPRLAVPPRPAEVSLQAPASWTMCAGSAGLHRALNSTGSWKIFQSFAVEAV